MRFQKLVLENLKP